MCLVLKSLFNSFLYTSLPDSLKEYVDGALANIFLTASVLGPNVLNPSLLAILFVNSTRLLTGARVVVFLLGGAISYLKLKDKLLFQSIFRQSV